MMLDTPVRLALFVIVRLATVAAVIWIALWRKSAGSPATLRVRRRTAVIGLVVWSAATWIEIATGSVQRRLALPLWLTLPTEVILVAMFAALPLLGFGLGQRLAAKVKPKAKRPISL